MELLANWFNFFFIFLFKILFPLFQNPILLSFIAILVLVSGVIYFGFKWIRQHKGFKSSGKDLLVFILVLLIELYLVLFWLWFVLIHFWTYRLLN